MSVMKDSVVTLLSQELETLRRENEALLRELENSYAQLTAVMQVSQDETRIAYAELQEKIVVLEKKLFELSFLAGVGGAFSDAPTLAALRRQVVEKICLILPADLVVLALVHDAGSGTRRERDVVQHLELEPAWRDALTVLQARVDQEGLLLAADLDAAPEAAALRLRPDARSAAAIPLRAGHLLGVLVLNSRLRANFRPDQEPLLIAFGTQAAAAIESALRLEVHDELLARLLLSGEITIDRLRAVAAEPTDASRRATALALRAAVREFATAEDLRLRAHLPSEWEES